ncbi:MAG: LysM peptidoglycan-binding domain-containing protein [Acidimicrobiales bacterium]
MKRSKTPRIAARWRIAAGVGVGVGIALVGVGVPLLLLSHGVGNGFWHLLVRPGDWRRVLGQPVSVSDLAAALGAMSWMLWCYMVVVFAVEVTCRIFGWVRPRLPGGRPAQLLAAAAFTSLAALVPSPRTTATRSGLGAELTIANTLRPSDAGPAPRVDLDIAFAQNTSGMQRYLVQRGDTLWSIAAAQLGTPERWREIRDLNLGRRQADSFALTGDNWLSSGWELVLPEIAVEPWLASHVPSRLPIEPIGSGITGAGVALLATKLRRGQRKLEPSESENGDDRWNDPSCTLAGAIAPPLLSAVPVASAQVDGMVFRASEDSTTAPGIEVEVKVLGPIGIAGNERPFGRAWALELVVYLAMHPALGASTEQWATALFPDRVLAAPSLHSIASAARRALGTASTGEDHLPRAHGRLVLGPSVSTDWARFECMARSDSPAQWASALSLVRGRAFEDLRSADWTMLEGIASHIERVVVDVACRYAEHKIVERDSSAVERAARQALLVSPYDERLYRLLLSAADIAGNPAGVEATMRELVALVGDGTSDPLDAVHPETWELYRSLSRKPGLPRGA